MELMREHGGVSSLLLTSKQLLECLPPTHFLFLTMKRGLKKRASVNIPTTGSQLGLGVPPMAGMLRHICLSQLEVGTPRIQWVT